MYCSGTSLRGDKGFLELFPVRINAPSSSSSSFLIVGGLYWVTALRKTGGEVKVYTKHQDLTQASKHHKQIRRGVRPVPRFPVSGAYFLYEFDKVLGGDQGLYVCVCVYYW